MSTALPVFFHVGPDLTLKTKAQKGRLIFDGPSIRLIGQGTDLVFPGTQLRSVTFVRPHAVGSVIKADLGSEFLFIGVTRFMVGQFALINYFATVRLFERLSEISPGPSTSEVSTQLKFNWKRNLKTFLIAALGSFALIAVLSFLGRNP
jgi:hypothetical protein